MRKVKQQGLLGHRHMDTITEKQDDLLFAKAVENRKRTSSLQTLEDIVEGRQPALLPHRLKIRKPKPRCRSVKGPEQNHEEILQKFAHKLEELRQSESYSSLQRQMNAKEEGSP